MKLQRGDIIFMGLPYSPIQHVAIYDGDGVYENRINENVIKTSLVEFLKRYDFWKVLHIDESYRNNPNLDKYLTNANNLLGKKYEILNYNCEHFIDEVVERKKQSESVSRTFKIVLLLIGSFFVGKIFGEDK